MQAHLLNDLVVDTPWGPRTLRVIGAQMLPCGSTVCHVDFCFAEEPTRAFGLEVFDGFLAGNP
jgi:hypothetical protein